MDRHFLLRSIYNSIKDPSKILLGKRVIRVDHSPHEVSVQCKDGSTYRGDIVIGADGVHSIVRSEMWRHMSITEPGALPEGETRGDYVYPTSYSHLLISYPQPCSLNTDACSVSQSPYQAYQTVSTWFSTTISLSCTASTNPAGSFGSFSRR